MKKLLLLISVVFISCFSYCQKPEKIRLKGVEMRNDYHEKISWVLSKKVFLNKSEAIYLNNPTSCFMQLYFGITEVAGKAYLTPLKLQNTFSSNEWVFFDEISFLFGTRKEIREWKGVQFKIYTSGRRKIKNGISEKSTDIVTGETKDLIKFILENEPKRIKIRYSNKEDNNVVTITVGKNESKKLKKHFKALIDSYNRLNVAYGLNDSF